MGTPNSKVIISTRRKWLRRILIAVAVIVLVPVSLFTIGWLNRDSVIDVLQEWYSENNTGTLTIGKVNANFLSGFPKVSFTLKDIEQTNTDTLTDQFSYLKIEDAKITISVTNLLMGNIKFEKIDIKNAIITSEVKSNKSLEYHQQLKRQRQHAQRKGFRLPEWINEKGAEFQLQNVQYITKDSILNKLFNLEIHKIKGAFKENQLSLNGQADFDITVNNLGFNTKKGSFFNGARVTGRPKFAVDLSEDSIKIPEFLLYIDSQIFKLAANFDLSEASAYDFRLQNPTTNLNAIKDLLSDSLAAKLKNYQLQEPFESNIHLAGNFAYGNSPLIEAEFSTENNTMIIADKLNFANTSFSGRLTNDIYTTDSLKTVKMSPKDIKIEFYTLFSEVEDVTIAVSDAYFQSTPEALNFIEGKINLKGTNEALAKIIDTDNFDFKGGTFQLNATISGDIPNPYQFLNKTTGSFKLNDTNVVLKKNGLQLPIQSIDLLLQKAHSNLRELIVNLPNGENLILSGELNNISGILSKDPKIPTTSQIYLDSKNLNINEIVALAKSLIPKSEANVNNRKNLHETLDAIYSQFHPRFEINVDTLQYNDVTITDLKSNIELTNSKTISLQNFNFNYLDAVLNLNGSVIVPEPESELKDAIYVNAKATSSGSITVFKDLFNIELFRLDSGEFNFYGTVKGNVKEFGELLNNASGDLTLTNTKLHYEPAALDIEIDSLALFVDKSDIILNKFNLEIGELYPLNLSGSITQFPGFLLDNTGDSGAVSLKISAPFLDGDELLTTLNSLKDEEKVKFPKNRRALHTVFKDINKFNPEIELSVDSIKYSDLITENIKALIYFENDSILTLKHLDLKYKETFANINGQVNAHSDNQDTEKDNPFDLNFNVNVKGKSEDLNDYLKTTNFIFKSGEFEFKGNYKAQSEDLNILNSNVFGDLKIGGTLVDFNAADLQIPVDSLHIQIDNDVATLKTLDIDLPGKSSVYFEGSIDNFSDFINSSMDTNLHNSNFSIHSPFLATSDIEEFLETYTPQSKKSSKKDFDLKKLKDALEIINTSFYPTVSMKIDTLRHENINLTDFGLKLLFDTEGVFKIQDTQINFYGGSIAMNVDVEIRNQNKIPFIMDMQATDIDLSELVTRFDYFKDEDLRNTEKIEGILNYIIKANGILEDDGKLNMGSLNGTIQFDLRDFVLFNYKPIMDNSVLMKDERFKNLRFQPIVQTFEIKNGEVIIPRTEIQSSAIHVFVEGALKLNDYINIWLAIPFKNLKRNDGMSLPEKISYDESGSKFFVQLLKASKDKKAEEPKLKVKVRLSDRKLRKVKDGQY